jgi:hypothetical protein
MKIESPAQHPNYGIIQAIMRGEHVQWKSPRSGHKWVTWESDNMAHPSPLDRLGTTEWQIKPTLTRLQVVLEKSIRFTEPVSDKRLMADATILAYSQMLCAEGAVKMSESELANWLKQPPTSAKWQSLEETRKPFELEKPKRLTNDDEGDEDEDYEDSLETKGN